MPSGSGKRQDILCLISRVGRSIRLNAPAKAAGHKSGRREGKKDEILDQEDMWA
jgi:hypothetical protein